VNPYTKQPLKVSEFISLVNSSLEQLDAFVEGEISQFHISHSKWVFFALKDEEAVVECFMPVYELKSAVEVGMKVLIWGSPNVHQKSGRFRIRVYKVEPSGQGALKRAFELTKARLEAEGLFAPERKRPLPEFPENIALITSRESAAYSDFIKVLKHRSGGIKIYLAHVHVQGIEAIDEIVGAFSYFNNHYKDLNLDAIALIRGGGSLEDLQAFNSEEVARAIFGAKVPVIVGVGHERDESLADYVADVRASTPSNAAELLVRSRQELLHEIKALESKIQNFFEVKISDEKFLIEKFFLQGEHFLKDKRSVFEGVFNVLKARFLSFNNSFLNLQQDFDKLFLQYEKSFSVFFQDIGAKLDQEKRLLESFNPLKILNRGYAIVKDKKSNKIIKSVKKIKKDFEITTSLKDGSFESTVTKINI